MVEEQDFRDYIQLSPDYNLNCCTVSIPITKDILKLQNKRITLRFTAENGTIGVQTFTIVVGGG